MRHGSPWGFSGEFPWGVFSFGRQGRFFGAGEVRLAILSLLSEGPKHGYQLMKELEERSGGMYRASAGSIYPTLQQLEDEELIEADQQGGKRVYRLTDAGRAELAKDPDAVRRIWERAGRYEDWGQYMRPENMFILGVHGPLGGVMKASLKAAARGLAEPVREILERTREELERL